MLVDVDVRQGDGRQHGQQLQNPSWEEVEQCVRQLDGVRRTEVLISHRGDDVFLGVCGGASGRYYVGVRTADEENLAVVGHPDAQGEVVMLTGGQEVRYPSRFLVDLETAIRVAKHYFEQSTLTTDVAWEPD